MRQTKTRFVRKYSQPNIVGNGGVHLCLDTRQQAGPSQPVDFWGDRGWVEWGRCVKLPGKIAREGEFRWFVSV
ncbi:MAG: hypothetical protein D6732_01630 [Methanobacteriota archaeon]|nr:MAG: hypothetical protein D6732_01630 [Euryarchaeota archaeon]